MTVRNDWVGHLRHYSLTELRRRQNLAKQQQKIAFESQNGKALGSLMDMEDSLAEAVYLNEFA